MSERFKVGTVEELSDGQLHSVDAGGTTVIVGLAGGSLCAANNKCPHLGLSLSKGPGGAKFEDGQVTCPWHNSVFELSTGENLDWVSGIAGKETPKWSRRLIALGRQPKSLTTYPVTVEGADVFVTV